MKFETILDNEVDAVNTLSYIVELFKPSGKRKLTPDGTHIGLTNASDLRLHNLEIKSGCIVENGQYRIVFETDRELVLLAAAHVFWDTIPSEIKMKAGCRVDMYQPRLMSKELRDWGLKRFQTDFKGDGLNTLPVGMILGRNPVLKPALVELEKDFTDQFRNINAIACVEYIRQLLGIKKVMSIKYVKQRANSDSYITLVNYYRWYTANEKVCNEEFIISCDNTVMQLSFSIGNDITLSLTAPVTGDRLTLNLCIPLCKRDIVSHIGWNNQLNYKPLDIYTISPELPNDYRIWAIHNFTGPQS